MAVDKQDVTTLFNKLQSDGDAFFAQVADDVDWTVEGTHLLAGHYRSERDFLDHTFASSPRCYPTARS